MSKKRVATVNGLLNLPDRTNDDELWAALEAMALPAVDPEPWDEWQYRSN